MKWRLYRSVSDCCSLWFQGLSLILRCCIYTVCFDCDFACQVQGAYRLLKHFFAHAKRGVNGRRWALVIECEEAFTLTQFSLDGVNNGLNL